MKIVKSGAALTLCFSKRRGRSHLYQHWRDLWRWWTFVEQEIVSQMPIRSSKLDKIVSRASCAVSCSRSIHKHRVNRNILMWNLYSAVFTQKETISEIHFAIISRLRCEQMVAYLKNSDVYLPSAIVGFFVGRCDKVNFIRWSSLREILTYFVRRLLPPESCILPCSAHKIVLISTRMSMNRRCQMSLKLFCEDRIKGIHRTRNLRSSILSRNTLVSLWLLGPLRSIFNIFSTVI